MLATNPLYILPKDYLAAEEVSPIRHEYRDGDVFAMIGVTRNHHTITGNLFFGLKSHLCGSGCRTFIEGMKTRVQESNAFYYPDVVVTCDASDRPNDEQYINFPCLIIEVLSPSTACFDRSEKFADDCTIPSLVEYFLVASDRQAVEHFQKGDRGDWNQTAVTDPIHFASINCTVSLRDIYDDTDLPLDHQ